MARYIGVDLHRNQFTVCILAENGREYLSEYRLEQLPHFVSKLRPTDELAVEVTGNTRLFYDAVAPHVAKVVVVNPTQFRLIRQSVKKTDPHDAQDVGLLPVERNVAGGANEGQAARPTGEPGADPRHAWSSSGRP